MTRYCFVSFLQPGHMDFGGHGFVRTAQELVKRGNSVTWLFSDSDFHDYSEHAHKVLKDTGIEYDKTNRFYLTVHHHHRNLMDSAGDLERYIQGQAFDCLVTDRLCVGAGFAAAWAGIPWATMGTDGREWSRVRQGRDKLMLLPVQGDTAYFTPDTKHKYPEYAQLSNRSYWATSPYLNLSFFPRSYYTDPEFPAIPAHSHFLGSGPDAKITADGDTVLITFGNTFHDSVKSKLVSCVLGKLKKRRIPALVLTGDESLTKRLQKEFVRFPLVTFKSWVPYDEAYALARVVIGHGGTSHVWTGIRNGVPLLVIPSMGDQYYGGKQVERLNIGRTIQLKDVPRVLALLPSFIMRFFPKRTGIDIIECGRALNQLLDDPVLLKASRNLSQKMQGGGGIHAAAELLERLPQEKAPITQCVPGNCCC